MVKLRKILAFILALSIVSLSITCQGAILDYRINGITGTALINSTIRINLEQTQNPTPKQQSEAETQCQASTKFVLDSIKPYGMFRAKIKYELTKKKNGWLCTLEVTPGKKLKIRHVSLHINDADPAKNVLEVLNKQLLIKPGDDFNVPQYNSNKQDFVIKANLLGYLDANTQNTVIDINLNKYYADIKFVLNTGPRYFFGKTTYTNNTYNPKFINRFAGFTENQPFSTDLVHLFHQALSKSSYFSQVNVSAKFRQASNEHIPIEVNYNPIKPTNYLAGIGYDTDIGAKITLGYNFNRLNSNGHKLRITTKAAKHQSEIDTVYVIPGKNPDTDNFSFAINAKDKKKDQDEKLRNISLTINDTIRSLHSYQNYSIHFLTERKYLTNQNNITTTLAYPQISLYRYFDYQNYNIIGKHGIEIKLAKKGVLSKIDFLQASYNLNILTDLHENIRLLVDAEIGKTWVNDFNLFPNSLSFSTGGAQSVRGYALNALGLHQKTLKTLSTEIQFKVQPSWYLTTFIDTGIASEKLSAPLNKSAGIGLLWQTPLGGLQLSYAKPIEKSSKLSDRKWLLQFKISSYEYKN